VKLGREPGTPACMWNYPGIWVGSQYAGRNERRVSFGQRG